MKNVASIITLHHVGFMYNSLLLLMVVMMMLLSLLLLLLLLRLLLLLEEWKAQRSIYELFFFLQLFLLFESNKN